MTTFNWFAEDITNQGRTKLFYMNLNLVKSARLYEITVSWNNTTLPYSFETEFWFLFFFFFRLANTNSPLQRIPQPDYPSTPSPFLAIVEPEWNFDLSYILREENDFSLRLWEKYSFLFHMFSCSFCMEFNKESSSHLWKLTCDYRGPAFEWYLGYRSQIERPKNTWVLDSIIKHLTWT